MSIIKQSIVLTVVVLLIEVSGGAGYLASEGTELRFDLETQNLHVLRKALRDRPPARLEGVCDDVVGELRYGAIPHRLYYESAASKKNFVDFVVAYQKDDRPLVFVDVNVNHILECDEQVKFVSNPHRQEEMFRTLTLHWRDDGGPNRKQRYRVRILAHPPSSGELSYSIDLVDVPVGRWSSGRHETIWILYDGNFNGLYDRRFGDGILVDASGKGQFSVSPYGENFFSYHGPIQLPWTSVEVVGVDPRGRSLQIEMSITAAVDFEQLREGDMVPPGECQSLEGKTVRLGGASGVYQVVFFWISNCGACREELKDITALLREVEPGRLSAVGVTMDEVRADAEELVAEALIGWPQCFSGRTLWDNELARRFGARSPSYYVLIDPAGRLAASGIGVEELVPLLSELRMGGQ